MREWRGLMFLACLTFSRQARARKTAVALVLAALVCLIALLWSQRRAREVEAGTLNPVVLTELFANQMVIPLFIDFLLPVVCLIFAVSALGEERDDRTLLHLLIRPLARYRIYLAKGLGVLPLVLVAALGSFALLCACAGTAGQALWPIFWPAVARAAIAYGCLFLLVGALFPRPMIVALVYTFLGEAFLGNMPGTIKRLAVSYHCRCIIYDAGASSGLRPPDPELFLAIPGEQAAFILDLAIIVLLIVGALFFHRKEYQDLS